jgi:hypothetical protein
VQGRSCTETAVLLGERKPAPKKGVVYSLPR